MDYEKYKNSRNASWQILIENHISELPVKVSQICANYGIYIVSYKTADEYIRKMNYENHTKENDAFIFKNIIFYNEKCSIGRQRFSIAHELGHFFLHEGNCIQCREPSPNDNPKEHEANVFASRLLAPACVLWGVGAKSPEQIAKLCDITISSATFRADRMNILYSREKDFILKHGKSCFLMSKLEQRVYTQFEDFIIHNKL